VHVFWDVERQEHAWQHQLHGFIPRVVGTMAIINISGVQATYCPTQHVLNGVKLAYGFIYEYFVQFSLLTAGWLLTAL
jgi:hypothetical protein